MKKTVILIGFMALSMSLFGQRTDFRAVLNSGLFSFAGTGPYEVTIGSVDKSIKLINLLNSFGTKQVMGYGFSGDIRHVSKGNFLSGVDLGVEVLKSKVLIDALLVNQNGVGGSTRIATGESYLSHTFLTLNPYIGYRFKAANVNIDATLGLDVAYNVKQKATQYGTATTVNDGASYTTDAKINTLQFDIRPRGQIGITLNRIGIFGGYSYGISNYQPNNSRNLTYFSRLIRFGLTFQINKNSL